MRTLRTLYHFLFALIIVASLIFQLPMPVSAGQGQPEPVQHSADVFHYRLSAEQQAHIQRIPETVPAPPSTVLTSGNAQTAGWTTILTEGFEGNFPQGNGWTLNDASTTDGGEYLFGPVTRQYRTGSRSGWEAAGGANGYGLAGNATYPNNLNTAMVFGPFDLSDAVEARMVFYYWSNFAGFIQQDGFGIGASIDGTNFTGLSQAGNNKTWTSLTYNFNNVDGSNLSYLGKSSVWVMFVVQTDASSSSGEGVYFDDILIEKRTSTTPTCYTLTTAASPNAGGSVAPSPAPNCNNGTQYTSGTVVTLTATANSGYTFANWSGDASGTSSPTTVTMTANRSVTANFTQNPTCYTLTINVSPAGSGSVAASPAANCNNGTQYTAGTVVTLTAAANSGYTFANWSGAVTGTTNPVTVTLSANRTVTANFTQPCYTLTIAASPSGGGSVAASPTPNCNNATQYTTGTEVTLTAAANSGYTFANWSGDATGTSNQVTVTMNANKAVTANFTQQCYTLTTTANPTGGGTIAASPQPNCNNGTQYTSNTQVQLTATAAAGYTFANWSGGATGTSNPVTVTMNASKAVTANFTQLCYTLTITVSPTGSGTVAASPQPNCNNGTQYALNTQVQLTATAAAGYTFANWTGGATGSANPVTVTMDGSKTVTANFTQQCYTLTTAASPNAGGNVTASPAANCNNGTQYTSGTVVTLTATANSGYTFANWSGDASGTSSPTTVTMTANRSVTANFTQNPTCYTLTTNVSPAGSGSVAASPSANCNNGTQYTAGTVVTLTATANSGYTFANWSGGASGTANPATVTMSSSKTVTANFTQLCYTLTIAASPSGGGSVAASPTPNCNNATQYTTGTEVTLTAAANSGYTFANWSGGATGTSNQVTVTMNANKAVTANFTQQCYTLTTTANPTGGGTIAASPQPNCNSGTQYTSNTQVQLTATASAGYTFANWSGGASGTANPVTVTMDSSKTVTGNFAEVQPCYTLSTAASPSAGGSVAPSPAPNCNNGTQYTSGTVVTLTATANSGYTFANWSGDASGTSSPTTVTMTANRSVTANFTPNPTCYTLTTNISPAGSGSVAASPAANCNNGTQYTAGTVVTLTAAANSGYTFANWSGAVTGTTNPVTVTLSANRTVTANFTQPCYTLTIAASPSGGGSVAASPTPNCNNSTQYTTGTEVTLTATANTGYTFASWTGGVTGTSNPVTVTMNANKAVTANFTQQCYSLIISVSPTGGGSVSASPAPNCNSTQYTNNTEVRLTATAADGYNFASWSGSVTETTNPITVTVDANKSITANFTSVAPTCYTLTTATSPVDGGTVAASPAPDCNHGTQYTSGTEVTLTATAEEGYTFTNWTGSVSGTSNPVTVIMNGNKSATAGFAEIPACYTLSTAVSPSDGGSVTASPAPDCNGATQYTAGKVVTLTATANRGYTFTNWSGDAAGPTSPITVTMTANRSVTASFTTIQQCYTLVTSVSPSGAGSVDASPAPNCAGNQYRPGTLVTLTATAKAGYRFDHWSGSVNGKTNPVHMKMNANKAVTANFKDIVANPNPRPVLESVRPFFFWSNSKDRVLILHGSGFTASSTVLWNGASLTDVKYLNKNTLQVTIPADLLKRPGLVKINVVNPKPGGGTSWPMYILVMKKGKF